MFFLKINASPHQKTVTIIRNSLSVDGFIKSIFDYTRRKIRRQPLWKTGLEGLGIFSGCKLYKHYQNIKSELQKETAKNIYKNDVLAVYKLANFYYVFKSNLENQHKENALKIIEDSISENIGILNCKQEACQFNISLEDQVVLLCNKDAFDSLCKAKAQSIKCLRASISIQPSKIIGRAWSRFF